MKKKMLICCCLLIGITTAAFAQTNHSSSEPLQKAKGLQKELKLSDQQTSRIGAIYEQSEQEFDKIRIKDHGVTNEMMKDVSPLRLATIKKIKKVLTPEQAVKYEKLLKGPSNQSLNGGWGDGWSSTATGN